MSQPPLRFVHASDFHLECPLSGVAEVPEHLRELFLEAPYRAAEHVFETALTEGADALLLCGDVVDFESAGPRAVVFLAEQFQRLASHGIAVYWACGKVDSQESWPACVELPKNVHIFPVSGVENIEHVRRGETVARIQGISSDGGVPGSESGFHRDAHGLFTVGLSFGTSASPGKEGDRVGYMALGGRHRRQTVDQAPGVAHYCGSPQGRSPSETGPRGCTLVTVDDAGKVKTEFVPSDAIRWLTEIMEVTVGTDEDALFLQIEDRIKKLRLQHSDTPLLVTWKIEGCGQILNHIREGGISDDIRSLLREQYGQQSPSLWTVGLECHSPLDVPQEWADEETIMGDLLREFRKLEADSDISLELEDFLPESLRDTSWAELACVTEAERGSLLWAASKMGVDMMDGEEALTIHDDK